MRKDNALDIELRLRISRDMRRKVRIAAAKADLSMSELVRRILEEWIERQAK